jgi:exopolysaccharide biosynthesis polyprenyl glycosylphosphotransferase
MLAPARRADRILSIALAAADILAIPFIMITTFWARSFILSEIPGFDHSLSYVLNVIPVVCVLWLVVFALSGLYRPRRYLGGMGETQPLIRALLYLSVALMAASYLTKSEYSRLMLLMFTLLSLPVATMFRILARRLAQAIAPVSEAPRVLVVGTGELAARVVKSLSRLPGKHPSVVGALSADSSETSQEVEGIRVVGSLADMPRLLMSMSIDEVFFASASLPRSRVMEAITDTRKDDVHFLIVTDLFEVAAGATGLDDLARLPIIEIGQVRSGLLNRAIKRLFDFVLSTVVIALLAPAFLAIYLALLLSRRGSPIFKQTRVGLRGRHFTLLKFRTMKPESGEYEVAPLTPDDSRITGLGRFLRRTSLDELPQLFNVLAGSMSLVGPRPEMPFIVEGYSGWQRRRLDVKPGITGLWQIMGRKDLPLHENLEYDFYYIRNHSLMLDFSILLRTVATVARGRGAY